MKMKNENVDLLIEKYLEGLTNLQEEQQLRDYFQKKNIPEHLEIYKPVFMFFSAEINRKYKVKYFIRNCKNQIIAIAAACLVLFLGIQLVSDNHTVSEMSIAYINGTKYVNKEVIVSETIESLNNLSAANADAYSNQIEAIEHFLIANKIIKL
jgi:hypothetical protein